MWRKIKNNMKYLKSKWNSLMYFLMFSLKNIMKLVIAMVIALVKNRNR
jgi:hypothetical protein